MTERLYLNDSYITECLARVINVEETDAGFAVEFDRTVLFPTSGGQPHDTGKIGDVEVFDVTEDGERVLHHTKTRFSIGDDLLMSIGWERRFDHMQQHSGEHLLSFAAKELFGAANVGFHMAANYCTADFNMPLSEEQLNELETYTNAIICLNQPVQLKYVEAEALEELELRKAAKGLAGTVRIVYMPGGDSCTCCGTHVNRTGEIGSLKITESMHYKGGERVTFVCGARALHHAQNTLGLLDNLARCFSCSQGDVILAAKKLQQESAGLKREQKALYTKLNAYLADELIAGAGLHGKARIIVQVVDIPPSQLRALGSIIIEKAINGKEKAVALLISRDGDNITYALCSTPPIDAGELIQPVNLALSGKGGGRNSLAQGSAKFQPGLSETVSQLREYFEKRLR